MHSAYAFAHTDIGTGELTQIVMTGNAGKYPVGITVAQFLQT